MASGLSEKVVAKAYRSAIQLIRFPDTGSHDCVGCKACERICPSACISVDGEKVEGIKKKRATHFEMDFALCSLGFFHRLLKEPCARMWNREDRVSGHFWEGRYQSLPVLDEAEAEEDEAGGDQGVGVAAPAGRDQGGLVAGPPQRLRRDPDRLGARIDAVAP